MTKRDYPTEEHIDAAYELGAKHERNKIAAWLRKFNYQQIADAIKAGEHLK